MIFRKTHLRTLDTQILPLVALLTISGAAAAGCVQASEIPVQAGAMATTDTGKTPSVGDTAPDFTLEALSGGKVKLSAVTSKGPVVLIVLRGFPGYQCPICTAQVGQLISDAPRFEAAKAKVILVYPGPADSLKKRADEFVKGKALPKNFTLLLDPDYTFTKQYGLRWDAPNETAYPSTFVLDSTRKITFAKISRSHGDRAKNADILKAIPAPPSKTGIKMSPS